MVWIKATTGVIIEGLTAGLIFVDNCIDSACYRNPEICKVIPEIFMNGRGIFQPEYEDETAKGYRVAEHPNFIFDNLFEKKLYFTEQWWKRAEGVTKDVGEGDKNGGNPCPTE